MMKGIHGMKSSQCHLTLEGPVSELGKEQSVMNRSQFGTGYRVNERSGEKWSETQLSGF